LSESADTYNLSGFALWSSQHLKVKVKGKVVPLLNLAPRHEDYRGIGGIAPRILSPRH